MRGRFEVILSMIAVCGVALRDVVVKMYCCRIYGGGWASAQNDGQLNGADRLSLSEMAESVVTIVGLCEGALM